MTIKQTVKAHIFMLMEQNMLEHGKTIFSTVLEKNNGLMDRNTKVTIEWEKNKVQDYISGLITQNIKDNGKIIKFMVMYINIGNL